MGPLPAAFFLLVTLAVVSHAQNSGFQLPTLTRDPPKPQIPADLASYFQLPDGGARRFVGSYLPGFIPPASFDVVDPLAQQQQQLLQSGAPIGVLTASNGLFGGSGGRGPQQSQSGLENGLNSLLSRVSSLSGGGQSPFASQLPAGFSSGLTFRPANKLDGNDTDSKNFSSSIQGIPNVFPSLPRAPVPQAPNGLPTLPVRPEVPQGGLGPLAGNIGALLNSNSQRQNLPIVANNAELAQPSAIDGLPQSLGSSLNLVKQLLGQAPGAQSQVAPGSPFLSSSGLQGQQNPSLLNQQSPYPQQAVPGNENVLTQLLRTVGLGGLSKNVDLSAVNQIFGQQQQSPQGGNGILSNVIYNALTDNNVQNQDVNNGTGAIDTKTNAALIQNLLTQPNSPFCNPKPTPVDKFNVDAFTGKWYQVLYSPPLSAGPCSMITYQKLADVGNGGPGTVFDTFEYTTEATPYGKPRISSGYGIVRGPGQLIYRTTNSPTDVNVYVLSTGPMNVDGQYEYIVMAVNCNYPLHVFARDPVVYKQKYEAEVNSMLEKKNLVSSWSRLLNMVASVDYNLCTFPPSLFNVRG